MMKSFSLLLIAILLSSIKGQTDEPFSVQEFIGSLKKPNNWGIIESFLDRGPMLNFFDYDTTIAIFSEAAKAFPSLVQEPFEFGKTFLGNKMYASAITLKEGDILNHQAILFDSLHHGREMLSLSIQLYTFAKLLSDYVNEDKDVLHLLKTTVIWFIPAVNTDGLIKLKDIINNQSLRGSVRKNFNRGDCKQNNNGGVDLNRNYDEHFGLDENGSSSSTCDEAYRGKAAFSEPETQAIKKFVEDRKNIKIAFNLHSYGNMWIRPINYSFDKQNSILQKMHKEYNIYQEFDEEAKFVNGTKTGNAIKALAHLGGQYTANGEATDWMLLKKKIIAMSPEIGDEQTEFFPLKHMILRNLQDNYPPINYMMMKILFSPKLQSLVFLNTKLRKQITKKYSIKPQEKNKLKVLAIEIFNSGIGDYQESEQAGSFIEFGFQRHFNISQIIEENKNNNSTIDQDNNSDSQKKYHYFHVQNIYYLDYDENYRYSKLSEMSIDDLNEQILDFKLREVSFKKNQEASSPLESRFKNKFSTYQVPFNQTFQGRTFRKYFVVFTTPLTNKNTFNLNVRIITDMGNSLNKKIFSLQQQNINIDYDGSIENIESNEQQEEEQEADDYPYYYSVILLLGLILMLLILKLVQRKRDNMTQFVNEISVNNMIEIN